MQNYDALMVVHVKPTAVHVGCSISILDNLCQINTILSYQMGHYYSLGFPRPLKGIGCETSILQSRSKQLNCGASRFQHNNSFDKQHLIPQSHHFRERAAMSKTRISSGMGWGEEKKKGGIFSC
ncbi:hypothetical protein OPV22_010183 [Ensete ventricosum]|uniref:Uncharacterized protein n=1 Tax=Ensete ventricosum TaxID=4639 RepID=A0AAV8RKB2_ENSVE|nr:hypothetical protein OPV22_010183 [Ensete ventricosum]